MGIMKWNKLKDAKVFGRGQYLKAPGQYKLTLQKMFTIETEDKGPALIVDFTVEESTHPEIPEGGTRNWYQGLTDKNVAFPAIKELLIALFDVDMADEEEVEKFEDRLEDLMEKCADEEWQHKDPEEHPLNGRTVAVECEEKITKKNKKQFTQHIWAPWDPEED